MRATASLTRPRRSGDQPLTPDVGSATMEPGLVPGSFVKECG
jgi:hypothetical protein